jgi:hypothetical protein
MLTNEQVFNQINPFVQMGKLQPGVDKLIDKAHELWVTEEGSVDDISVIIISFN